MCRSYIVGYQGLQTIISNKQITIREKKDNITIQ